MKKIERNAYIWALGLIFLLGLILRIKSYIVLRDFWIDEAALADNIITRGFWGFFAPLDHIQHAPPFFLMATKLLTRLFGESEYVFRFLPLTFSILSLPLFYLVSKEFFAKKFSIVAACFLFAANYRLIYYAQEFKQYSLDVFFVLLALYLCTKVNLTKLSYKKTFGLGVLALVFLLSSTPAAFAIGAFCLYSLKDFSKNTFKKLFIFALPFLVVGPFYYFYSLLPAKQVMLEYFTNMWGAGFLEFNFTSFKKLVISNVYYYITPNVPLKCSQILLVFGFALTLFQKGNKFSRLAILTLFCAIVASLSHIYIIKDRVSLYLLPIILLIMAKPFDLISWRTFWQKILTVFIIVVAFFTFNGYDFNYFKDFTYKENKFMTNGTKKSLLFLQNSVGEDETLVYVDKTYTFKQLFDYYCRLYSFSPKKFIYINLPWGEPKSFIEKLNKFPKGSVYWFFFANEFEFHDAIPYVQKWAREGNKKILFEELTNGHKYILKIRL